MSMKKRVIASVLSVLTVGSVLLSFAACSDKKDETPAGTTETKPVVTTDTDRLYPDLPDVNFNGYTFTIAEWDIDGWGMIDDIFAEASDDNRLSTAIYNRNEAVNEQYGVTIECMKRQYDQILTLYNEQVSTADQDVDVFLVRSHEMQFVVPNNLAINLYEVPHLNFGNPWWDANAVDQFSINGKLYEVESDMTLRDKNATACVMFNKQVQEDYQIGDLYSLVGSDDWTWDKMIELSKKATAELDGNGVMDQNDCWGLISLDDLTYIMLHGGGGRYATKDENDIPVPGFDDARTLEVAQKVIDILYNDTYFWHLAKGDGTNSLFDEDRALFYTDAIFRAQGFADMETDFGIMPVPKYDSTQKEYGHSVSIHFSSAISVPMTNTNLETIGVILEALAAESKYTVIPEYYDLYVKVRNTRDEEAKDMLDLIFATRVYDLGEFFNFGTFNSAFLRIWTNKAGNSATTLWAEYKDKVNAAIDQFVEKVVDTE